MQVIFLNPRIKSIMQYNFQEIEKKWQEKWEEQQTFAASDETSKPKYYVLDMFPYPSGAGLHVGHPLGYIASDIYSRFKRHQGFNVLHPMGYDSFGLPAEQYAIQTGQHPAVTTEVNISGGTDNKGNQIAGYDNQLKKLGFSYDWKRAVRTSNPDYYKWTQWIFIQLFNSYYCNKCKEARPIEELKEVFSRQGNADLKAFTTQKEIFTAQEWKNFSGEKQQEILLNYRLAYRAETTVNWCPALGTVLANDEIVNGVSERGGYPVYQKKMMQWSMRITAYAERLLIGLDTVNWSEAIKESQRNWIGKSQGAEVEFSILSFPKGEEKDYGYTTGGNNVHLLLEKAKKMRDNPTPTEKILWEQLKSKALDYKFRRQHLIDDFIVDFVCLSKKLVIEVDGEIHNLQEEDDKKRTEILNKKGFKVIRFKNEEVIGNINGVLNTIKEILSQQPNLPLSFGEGLGVRIKVFTTRPDTIYGATFMVLAPEHPLVDEITTGEYYEAVNQYKKEATKRSERDRMADAKTVSGQFTGAYAVNPFTHENIPVYIADYVLMGYGTGAIMAVPAHDERDHRFARHFEIPIIEVIEGGEDVQKEAFSSKDGICINSKLINGLSVQEAQTKIIGEIEKMGIGHGTINYRLRDAVFSRQRYWGEPFPIYYKNNIPYPLPESALPLILPEVEKYLPTEDGDPPLGQAKTWAWDTEKQEVVSNDLINHTTIFPLELNTMPGWAGSSWYYLRYTDSQNPNRFADDKKAKYWENVDLYIGGSEHATGHLLYSRFWNKFLKDYKYVNSEEPFQKLINQGMIQGVIEKVYRNLHSSNILHKGTQQIYIYDNIEKLGDIIFDKNCEKEHIQITTGNFDKFQTLTVPIEFVKDYNNSEKEAYLDEEGIKKYVEWHNFENPVFVTKDGFYKFSEHKFYDFEGNSKNPESFKFYTDSELGKMSKSKYNVINPDDVCAEYGADTLRMYEMFLGPLEHAKPWNTQGLVGVHGFLKKFWRLYHSGENETFSISEEKANKEELRTLHQLIKKVTEDIENFSFNTSISSFMIATNELAKLKCNKREILEPLTVLISPYAPHIAEELWEKLGHTETIEYVPFPTFNASYLVADNFEYPVSFNGKVRFKIEMPASATPKEVEEAVLAHEKTSGYLDGKQPKKIIVVTKRIVNIVL